MYSITYNGPWLSWNTMLSNNRWQRSKIIAEVKPMYRAMFKAAGIKPMDAFRIEVRYWSKIDADNIVMKYCIDTLRSEGLVTNDDKRYFGGISYQTDCTLKHNTYVISIIPMEVDDLPSPPAKKKKKD